MLLASNLYGKMVQLYSFNEKKLEKKLYETQRQIEETVENLKNNMQKLLHHVRSISLAYSLTDSLTVMICIFKYT